MSAKHPSSKTHNGFVFEPLETPQTDRVESTYLIDLRRPKDGSERRRYRRVSVALPVKMSTVEPEHDPEIGDSCLQASEAVCLNVSRGGALIRADEAVRSGKKLRLELDLANGRIAELMGRVVWAKRTQEASDTEGNMRLGIEWMQGGQETLIQHFAL